MQKPTAATFGINDRHNCLQALAAGDEFETTTVVDWNTRRGQTRKSRQQLCGAGGEFSRLQGARDWQSRHQMVL